MLELTSKVRQWGRSLGVVLPKSRIKSEGIGKNDVVSMLIRRKTNVLKQTFGTLHLKRSTEEILKESDEESWDE